MISVVFHHCYEVWDEVAKNLVKIWYVVFATIKGVGVGLLRKNGENVGSVVFTIV